MATLVKPITYDKIKVGDRIRIEETGDIIEMTVSEKYDTYGPALISTGDLEWCVVDNTRLYRLKEDS